MLSLAIATRKIPAFTGIVFGGGGGTAYPYFSIWAGLYLHPLA